MDKKLKIIGGGAGGCKAALLAAKQGFTSVELWEKDKIGGMCLNFGCIPAKMLLRAADRLDYRGGFTQEDWVNLRESIAVKTELLRRGMELQLQRAGVKVVHAEADADSLGDGNVILALGRSWMAAPEVAGKRTYGFREVFSMETLPEDLAIIGAGAAGLELAQAFAGLGCHVTVYEQQERALPSFDEEIAERYMELCAELGIDFILGQRADLEKLPETDIVFTGTGDVLLDEQREALIAAAGKTTIRIGDCSGTSGTAYEAEQAAEAAIDALLGKNASAPGGKLQVVCGKYDLAVCGEQTGLCAEADCSKNGYAFAMDETGGFARLYCNAAGILEGAVMMLPHAGELAGTLCTMIGKLHIADLAKATFFHPSISECVHEAAVKLNELL